MEYSSHKPSNSTTITTTVKSKTTTTTTTTTTEIQANLENDWDKPFTDEELEAIEAAFQAATAQSLDPSPSSSSSFKHRRYASPCDGDDPNARPKTRRRLPDSVICSNEAGSFALQPCPSYRAIRQASVKMKYHAMNFGGQIVYSRTVEEVEEATLQIMNLLVAKKQEAGQCVLGLDIEWKPSFDRGIPQGKAAVMQICGDMNHCYVLHIFHSGIPPSLQFILEDPTFIKVGVGTDNDAVKVFHDHNVSIRPVEDLSSLANKKLGGAPKQWSLSSLVETLTCKQLLKPKDIRLGNWETAPLSKAQLRYAATDAFASWYLYEVLMSFPDLSENRNEI